MLNLAFYGKLWYEVINDFIEDWEYTLDGSSKSHKNSLDHLQNILSEFNEYYGGNFEIPNEDALIQIHEELYPLGSRDHQGDIENKWNDIIREYF